MSGWGIPYYDTGPERAVEKAQFLCFMYRHGDMRGVCEMLVEIDATLYVLPSATQRFTHQRKE